MVGWHPWNCCHCRKAWLRGWFLALGSSWEEDGTVKKCSWVIIFWLIPVLNSLTCFLIYLRNASLDQRPNNIIVNTGMPARYIAMAAPLHAEWRPIWFAVNPSSSLPIAVAAKQRRFSSTVLVNKVFDPSLWKKVFTDVSSFDEG